MFLRLGYLNSGSRSASSRDFRDGGSSKQIGFATAKVVQTRSGSGQMVLRSAISCVSNRAKTEMSGEAETNV
jgi:hypothetical protein